MKQNTRRPVIPWMIAAVLALGMTVGGIMLHSQLNEKDASIKKLSEEKETLISEKADAEEQVSVLTAEKAMNEQTIETLTAEKTEAEKTITVLTSEKTAAEEQISTLTAEKSAAEKQIDTLTEEKAIADESARQNAEKAKTFQTEIQRLLVSEAALQDKVELLETAGNRALARSTELEKQLNEKQAELDAAQTPKEDLSPIQENVSNCMKRLAVQLKQNQIQYTLVEASGDNPEYMIITTTEETKAGEQLDCSIYVYCEEFLDEVKRLTFLAAMPYTILPDQMSTAFALCNLENDKEGSKFYIDTENQVIFSKYNGIVTDVPEDGMAMFLMLWRFSYHYTDFYSTLKQSGVFDTQQ